MGEHQRRFWKHGELGWSVYLNNTRDLLSVYGRNVENSLRVCGRFAVFA